MFSLVTSKSLRLSSSDIPVAAPLDSSRAVFEELKSEQGIFHVSLALGQLALHEGKEEEALGHFARCASSSDLLRSNKELLGVLYQLYSGRDPKKAAEIKALLDSNNNSKP
jgi:hypothetical protein